MTAARAWLWATILLTAGALASAVALAPPAGAPPVRALSWLLFTGSSVHVASTGWLFTVPAVRAYAREHAVRCLWIPVSLVVVAAIAAAAIRPAAFGWLLLPVLRLAVLPLSEAEHRDGLARRVSAAGAAAAPGGAAAAAARRSLRPSRPWPPGPDCSACGWHRPCPRCSRWPERLYAVAVAAGLAALARRPAAAAPGGFLRRLPDLPVLLAARRSSSPLPTPRSAG